MNLQLSLKKQWFEMTDPLCKTEDYREINEYWFKRIAYQYKHLFKYLCGFDWDFLSKDERNEKINLIISNMSKRRMIAFKSFSLNIMTLGYPAAGDLSRFKKFEHAGIEIRTGNHDWGAEPGKLYFVIKHGKML